MRNWLARILLRIASWLVGDVVETEPDFPPVCALCGREADPNTLHQLAEYWELGFVHCGKFIHAPLCPCCVHKHGRLIPGRNVIAVGKRR